MPLHNVERRGIMMSETMSISRVEIFRALAPILLLILVSCRESKSVGDGSAFFPGNHSCSMSPHKRLADRDLLREVKADAFGGSDNALRRAISEGRMHWTWLAAPGRKWPTKYSKSVYNVKVIVLSYTGPANRPGAASKRLFVYGLDACGSIIGGREGVERSPYLGDE